MNDEPQFCNYCRKVTGTDEGDCVQCGFSKPFPDSDPNEEFQNKVLGVWPEKDGSISS